MAVVQWCWHSEKGMFLSFSSNLAFRPPRQLHPTREPSSRLGTSVHVLGGTINANVNFANGLAM